MLKISPKFLFLNNISIFRKIEIFGKNLNDPSKVVGQKRKPEFAANRVENRIFD